MGAKFEVPTDPTVKIAGAITIGAVLVLLFIGRAFRDCNPA